MTIKTVKGFHDTLPDESNIWRWVSGRIRETFQAWGFREIRLPLVERTELHSGDGADAIVAQVGEGPDTAELGFARLVPLGVLVGIPA